MMDGSLRPGRYSPGPMRAQNVDGEQVVGETERVALTRRSLS
jgi:hypothetical protein